MMDEQALMQRANEERARLFQRYDHGREPGAEIDSWEDPGFEVYHQTDRYGFIHDKRLPQKVDPNEVKSRSIEMERVKKWLKMLNSWGSRETTEKIHRRIYKGIPDKLRSKVWMKLLNVEKTMAEQKDVYQNMLKLARQWSTEARQIDSDVNRQFREHLFYRERYNIKQKSLFNVLTAYSMYNMEVGYCQGMSGVAGVLLMYMDEEEAFWALSTLLADKKFAMHGLYIEGFPKLNRLVQHHDRIIEKFMPKLKKHFDLHCLDSMIYSLKWFFVIFIERIPFSLCLRVWDIYLLDGERVVTAMAYTILRLHQKKLVKLKDMDLLVQYLQTKLHKDFGYDDDYVIKALEQSMEELRKSKLDLALPPTETEFPKRPFGVFVEPTPETKIGRRKSIFTETEKEVTENVILRREQTQQDLAESLISDGGLAGSNSQLNTTGNIPESEDGGSLLGSSRKSLADTSVTSTADLSVFSTGQRSHQFDICIDDARSMRSDPDGEGDESSPGSAFGSLSIVGRTSSAIMITPTPRAISPHDILRIYVPPAPPEENQTKSLTPRKRDENSTLTTNFSPLNTCKNVLASLHVQNISTQQKTGGKEGDQPTSPNDNTTNSNGGSNRNSVISGDITPKRASLVYRSDEDLSQINGRQSSSSSRRGSLSRKSPTVAMDRNALLDCEHLRMKRRSIDTSDEQINRSSKKSDNTFSRQQQDDSLCRSKLMTSFEELARLRKDQAQRYGGGITNIADKRMTKSTHCERRETITSDDEDPTSSHYKFESDCNIRYRELATSPSPIDFGQSSVEYGSGGSDYHRKTSDNSDGEYSSSSPNFKSVLTTPVNEEHREIFPIITAIAISPSSQKLLTSGETTPTHDVSNNTMTNNRYSAPILLSNQQISSASSPTSRTSPFSTTTITGINASQSNQSFDRVQQHHFTSSSSLISSMSSCSIAPSSGFRPRIKSSESGSIDNARPYIDLGRNKIESKSFHRSESNGSSGSVGGDFGAIDHTELSGKIIMRNNDFDNRIAAPIGGAYDFKNHRETNKIRIKIQQNQ